MTKAHIITATGAQITVEGTPQEVAAVIKEFGGRKVAAPRHDAEEGVSSKTGKQKPSPVNLISSLIDGGFFKKPKDLGSVKVALEEMGHYYPVTTLSPAMLRFVRRRQLRRLKENKRWLYTG